MKKILVILFVFSAPFFASSQTCEQREAKLLEALGSFSAGYLYNTYGMIGGIVDAYSKEAYTAKRVTELLDEQKNLVDNLAKTLSNLKDGGYLPDQQDKDYVVSANSILNGLKRQANLFETYMDVKTDKSFNDYNDQRQKNWKEITKLMGLDK